MAKLRIEHYWTIRGNDAIIVDGYKYRSGGAGGKSHLWRCVLKQCGAYCRTDLNATCILRYKFCHEHPETAPGGRCNRKRKKTPEAASVVPCKLFKNSSTYGDEHSNQQEDFQSPDFQLLNCPNASRTSCFNETTPVGEHEEYCQPVERVKLGGLQSIIWSLV